MINEFDLQASAPMTMAAKRGGYARFLSFLTLIGTVLGLGSAAAAPVAPPGFNVHLVRETQTGRFWRGGAPKRETLDALAKSAKARGVELTLLDLRKPANADDRSGKGQRLSPTAEEALARKLGLRYVAISALDRGLTGRMDEALGRGDIYMHCMYGVNRTGFATARYARSTGVSTGDKGLGKRDWRQGDAFQRRIQKSK
jgi:hypothetical protein